jgi:hypothetical protein
MEGIDIVEDMKAKVVEREHWSYLFSQYKKTFLDRVGLP